MYESYYFGVTGPGFLNQVPTLHPFYQDPYLGLLKHGFNYKSIIRLRNVMLSPPRQVLALFDV